MKRHARLTHGVHLMAQFGQISPLPQSIHENQQDQPSSSTRKMADDNPEDNPPVEEEQQEEPTAEEEAEGPKRIVICGATGRLGGSVLRRLQSDGGWEIRAVTRTPDSDAATALADSGIEVVSGNYDDEESLITAFDVRRHNCCSCDQADQFIRR